jgi:hypothetical protein
MRPEPDFEDGQRGGVDALLRLRGVGASIHRPQGSLEANYRFMIHARQDVKDLCAELRTERRRVESLSAERAEHLDAHASLAIDNERLQGELATSNAEITRLLAKLAAIGWMFTGPEGIDDSVRAVLACPHNEPLHFHSDGCPSCIEDEADR